MSAELSIGILRLPSRSLDAEATVRRLGLVREPDRRVLVVRRLRVRADDPAAARQQLDELRRHAARPARGPVDPHAEAVEFADEAEALRCLSEDVATGVAGLRWWWRGSVPSGPPGEALTSAWTGAPRWVPAALAPIARERPSAAAAMVSLLSPEQVVRVVDAVATAYGLRVSPPGSPVSPSAGAAPVRGEAHPGRESLPVPARGAALLLELARVLDERPAAVTTAALESWLETSRALIAAAPAGAEVGSPATSSAVSSAESDASATSPLVSGSVAVAARPVVAGAGPVDNAAEPTEPDPPTATDQPSDTTVTPFRRRRLTPRDQSPSRPDGAPWRHAPWTSSGPSTRTELATMLYAINLVRRLVVAPRGLDNGTGWAVVEAISRWLLRGLPLPRRRRLLGDPLFQILAELDGRPADVPTPVRLGAATRPVRRFLTEHRLAPDIFVQPGTIVVSRTHVDVILGLEQIDLAARSAGLDQDPGWVPDLGRVVLFHFEGS